SKAFSAAITAASSAATPVIPPGVNLIVFTLIAQASLGRMFAAGYVPGFLMSISMMITVAIIAKKRNYPKTREKFPPLKEVLKQAFISFWGLFFPFGIILGMRFGMFTPSEGGAFAVLYCFIIGKLVYKKLSFREHLIPIILDTIAGTSSVVLIMVSANVFGNYMSWVNLPKIVAKAVLDLTTNKYVFLMLCNVILLIMGMFLEGGAALMIITPLLLPVATQLGIDTYHFGIVALVNIMIGGITPPFGSMMFTTCGITRCPISEFLKEVWPFILCLFLVLMLLTFCPTLVTIVPNLLYGA
ncbi:MAG: TRAP transporter large permease, partial [Candidatus Ventricola sp.]|nr:TRAP transporter large permease [Candidatus Ventricola sp.]